MSIISNTTFFFLSVMKMFSGEEDAPVTLENVYSKFQHLYYDSTTFIYGSSELDKFVKSLSYLNVHHPLRLLEIAKESHCLALITYDFWSGEKVFQ
jgi:hypothetical protein